MKLAIPIKISNIILAVAMAVTMSCGGAQTNSDNLDTRPLEETKAFEIINQILTERGYLLSRDVRVKIATDAAFPCDFRINGNKIAIEYLTQQDRLTIGNIPAAAPGSRLHVLPAKAVSEDPNVQGESIYIFFIDESDYIYQYNPTSNHRADVTFMEVDSRLRRDLADFLTWYENSRKNEK